MGHKLGSGLEGESRAASGELAFFKYLRFSSGILLHGIFTGSTKCRHPINVNTLGREFRSGHFMFIWRNSRFASAIKFNNGDVSGNRKVVEFDGRLKGKVKPADLNSSS